MGTNLRIDPAGLILDLSILLVSRHLRRKVATRWIYRMDFKKVLKYPGCIHRETFLKFYKKIRGIMVWKFGKIFAMACHRFLRSLVFGAYNLIAAQLVADFTVAAKNYSIEKAKEMTKHHRNFLDRNWDSEFKNDRIHGTHRNSF